MDLDEQPLFEYSSNVHNRDAMATDSGSIKEKSEALAGLLREEDHILVHIDTAIEHVTIPPNLKAQRTVTLKLSLLFKGKTELLDEFVKADLLFGGKYFECFIPYACIWGISAPSGKNLVWPASTPAEVLEKLLTPSSAPKTTTATLPEKPKKKERPTLRRVK